MSKSNYKIIEDMRDALMAVYRDVAPKCFSQRDAWEQTIKHPAPRYYVSPKQAYQRLLPLLDGDTSGLDAMKPERRRMYMSIFEKVMEASQRREFAGKSLWYIIPWVVSQPAPEFFIGAESIRKTFRYVKGNRFDGGKNWSSWTKKVKG